MACSNCGEDGHRAPACIRTKWDEDWGNKADKIICLCRKDSDLLVHLYHDTRRNHFFSNLDDYLNTEEDWVFEATQGHGIGSGLRPVLNFFVADDVFASNYKVAATQNGFTHGLIIQRQAIRDLFDPPQHDLCEVEALTPASIQQMQQNADWPGEDAWRYDQSASLPRRVGALAGARVVRFATTEPVEREESEEESEEEETERSREIDPEAEVETRTVDEDEPRASLISGTTVRIPKRYILTVWLVSGLDRQHSTAVVAT